MKKDYKLLVKMVKEENYGIGILEEEFNNITNVLKFDSEYIVNVCAMKNIDEKIVHSKLRNRLNDFIIEYSCFFNEVNIFLLDLFSNHKIKDIYSYIFGQYDMGTGYTTYFNDENDKYKLIKESYYFLKKIYAYLINLFYLSKELNISKEKYDNIIKIGIDTRYIFSVIGFSKEQEHVLVNEIKNKNKK